VPTGIETAPLGQKPVHVMMRPCGQVGAVYIPKPVDQPAEWSTRTAVLARATIAARHDPPKTLPWAVELPQVAP
jgi:hypothetical protein